MLPATRRTGNVSQGGKEAVQADQNIYYNTLVDFAEGDVEITKGKRVIKKVPHNILIYDKTYLIKGVVRPLNSETFQTVVQEKLSDWKDFKPGSGANG